MRTAPCSRLAFARTERASQVCQVLVVVGGRGVHQLSGGAVAVVHAKGVEAGLPAFDSTGWGPASPVVTVGRFLAVIVGCLWLMVIVTEHEVAEPICRFHLHARNDMGVDVHREGDRGVTEAFRDDLGQDAGIEQPRGMGVAEVVEADAGDLGACHPSSSRPP